jgi:hypothetical protein
MAEQPAILSGIVVTPAGLAQSDEIKIAFKSIFAHRIGLLWHSPFSIDMPKLPGIIGSFERQVRTADGAKLFIVGALIHACMQKQDGRWQVISFEELNQKKCGFDIPPNADVIFTHPMIAVSDKEWLSGLSNMLPSTCAHQVLELRRRQLGSN